DPGCVFNPGPEDATRLALTQDVSRGSAAAALSSDTVKFARFMRLLAPPAPAQPTQGSRNGRQVFDTVGCQACHIPTQVTGPSRFAALDKVS
ncbi:di-heme oxidoredictase family protein, partial [Acinetobacter baumannii]